MRAVVSKVPSSSVSTFSVLGDANAGVVVFVLLAVVNVSVGVGVNVGRVHAALEVVGVGGDFVGGIRAVDIVAEIMPDGLGCLRGMVAGEGRIAGPVGAGAVLVAGEAVQRVVRLVVEYFGQQPIVVVVFVGEDLVDRPVTSVVDMLFFAVANEIEDVVGGDDLLNWMIDRNLLWQSHTGSRSAATRDKQGDLSGTPIPRLLDAFVSRLLHSSLVPPSLSKRSAPSGHSGSNRAEQD